METKQMNRPFPIQQKQQQIEEETEPKQPEPFIIPHPEKPGYYQCNICKSIELKTKHILENHVKECLRTQQRKKKNQEEKQLIDTTLLYNLIIQLQKEVATLRQQMKDMKKQELQRINIQFWLNNHCNDIPPYHTFNVWRKSSLFQPTNEQLQMVFHSNIKKGIQDCIRNVLETENPATFPIRAFDKQKHVFYIYDKSLQPPLLENENQESLPPILEWRKMSKEEFHNWLEMIAHKFLLKFEEWEEINQEWLENETNNQERIKYSEKITEEIEMPQTIRNWLYDEIKRPLKRVVELDFEDL